MRHIFDAVVLVQRRTALIGVAQVFVEQRERMRCVGVNDVSARIGVALTVSFLCRFAPSSNPAVLRS